METPRRTRKRRIQEEVNRSLRQIQGQNLQLRSVIPHRLRQASTRPPRRLLEEFEMYCSNVQENDQDEAESRNVPSELEQIGITSSTCLVQEETQSKRS